MSKNIGLPTAACASAGLPKVCAVKRLPRLLISLPNGGPDWI